MVTLLCFCCDHCNPAGAKFCNACGTPLHLKPCPHCEAINERAAAHCHQCGEAFGLEFLTRADAPPLDDEPNAAIVAARTDDAGDAARSRRARNGVVPTRICALLLIFAGAALLSTYFAYRHVGGGAPDAIGAAQPFPDSADAAHTQPAAAPVGEPPRAMPVAAVSPVEPRGGVHEQAAAPRINVERMTLPKADGRRPSAHSGSNSKRHMPQVGTKSGSAAARPAIGRNRHVPDADAVFVRSREEDARISQLAQGTMVREAGQIAPPRSFAVTSSPVKQRPRDSGRRLPSTVPAWDWPCAEGVALDPLCDVRMMAKGN